MQKLQKVRTAVKFACAGAVIVLSGCSLFSGKAPSNPPAPLVQFKPALTVRTVWSASVGNAGEYTFSPAVSGASVYAASADGTVTRIDAAKGVAAWRINAGMKLTAGVGTDGFFVAVAGEKGALLVYDAEGKLRWKAQASSEILSSPAVGQGLVIVRSLDNRITAYDAESGERKWTAQRSVPSLTLRSAPGILIVAQAAFVALPGGRLSALNLANGGPWWEMAIGDPRGTTELERVADASGMPLLTGKDVCAVAYQGRVGCFDGGSGAAHWVKNFSSAVGVGGDDRNLYAADEHGAVSAFTIDNGTVVWRSDALANRQLSSPVAFGPSVAVGDFEGYIHFLSRENGSLVARVRADKSAVLPTSVVAGSNVIFQTKSGTLIALATE
ncbi:outer membrane protein assembly factor BamB [Glaciimonas immobilis]|uniref:Outer membrane protein assembly factor BamB n=1 Tax=Glaciimonas immobilis TaxID=728004 RepID=A0A840RNM9_9BURK|nr:outer membrane protein assembly factor BamB [Glaciimonas immobilis]KAF3998856.1 outer membrane protein assembly factor BamB [Glaciimonas immobilis]MBB5198251.1 outer membrane protein assembly factor BamB [Glaciimonas immobilis]